MDLTDNPTLPEALAVLDDAIELLDGALCALYVIRDTMPAEQQSERETLALAADLFAQAWTNALRGRQTLAVDLPAHLTQALPAVTAADLARQDAAALSAGRWAVRADRRCAGTWLVHRPDGAIAFTFEGDHAAAVEFAAAAAATPEPQLRYLDAVLA